MSEVFQFADDLGPAKLIGVYEPKLGLRAMLVLDNAAVKDLLGKNG